MTETATAHAVKRCKCRDHDGPNPLPVNEFGKNRSKPDGLTSWCRPCENRRERQRYAANSEAERERVRQWRAANPDAAREGPRRWRDANRVAVRERERRRRATNLESVRERERRWRDANREAVLDHYGRSCACCGSTDRLEIDHVNGDGKQHRERIGRGHLDQWLVASGFPEGFQTLCSSCNRSKGTRERCQLHHAAASAA